MGCFGALSAMKGNPMQAQNIGGDMMWFDSGEVDRS